MLLTVLYVVLVAGYGLSRVLLMVSLTQIQIYENIYYGTQAGPDQPLGAKEGITFAFGIADFVSTDVSND